jgi:hypothetical protein
MLKHDLFPFFKGDMMMIVMVIMVMMVMMVMMLMMMMKMMIIIHNVIMNNESA